MTVKKNIKKRIAVVAAVVLLLVLLFFINVFVGNPISRGLAYFNTKNYISYHFIGSSYSTDKKTRWKSSKVDIGYDPINGNYIATAHINDEPDYDITFYFNSFGGILSEDAHEVIQGKKNLLNRLANEYNGYIRDTFSADDADMTVRVVSCLGKLCVLGIGDAVEGIEGLSVDKLELGYYYPTVDIGKQAGILHIETETSALSDEEIAGHLREITAVLKEKNTPFAGVEFSFIDRLSGEDGSGMDTVWINTVTAQELENGDFTEIVKTHKNRD